MRWFCDGGRSRDLSSRKGRSALARGAKIYCELAGYGSSGDAEHVTTAREDGKGAAQAMLAALEDANVEGDQV